MKKQHSHNQIVTCLFGDPVEHSVSDYMFRYFAKLTGVENYNHLKFRIPKNDSENLKLAMRAMSVFNIVGANITLLYKENAIKYLNKDSWYLSAVGNITKEKLVQTSYSSVLYHF